MSVPTGPCGAPIVRGVELVRICRLPDQTAKVFNFDSPCFNVIQSKCFRRIWSSNDNFVLSAPTGSGKTAVLELAICRLFNQDKSQPGHSKVVYQAPTKALCSERQRDWEKKFVHLGLKCRELTGDSDQAQLKRTQEADIIVTTPEKWDSITRKWTDHRKLMELIRLFLIDEVHILKEDRGASLEAIVSRMKTVGSEVRFLALSATIPNSDDIASWLGRDPSRQDLPAAREVFDDSYRAVAFEKHVYGYVSNNSNEFQFDQTLSHRILEIIPKHSKGKPIIIFCITRKSAESTALFLAEWWITNREQDRFWGGPTMQHAVTTPNLQECMLSGVAFHHAGLDEKDRRLVEKCFLEGQVSVICCTSTLAVGINLPCHLVVIKNTVAYQSAEASFKELSDLDLMQMLGRAGRPQFDRSAVAVVMTRQEKARRYQLMVSGQEVLESTLHNNLIEHINAEIGLGTIFNLHSAQKWLEGTFLFVRLSKNPSHYKVHGDNPESSLNDRARQICKEALHALEESQLITSDHILRLNETGDAMARYFVAFETMKMVLGLPPKAKASEIISVIAQASEFKGIRIRSGEKTMLKEINKSPMMKFPIKVNIAMTAHKVSIIIQATLGGIELLHESRYSNLQRQFTADLSYVFRHIHRLIRCIIDCQIQLKDSVGARNALELARSLAARAWDDSPLQMIQIEKIGPVAVRKLVGVGIRSIEDLENTEAHKIDMTLSKNPPFGANLLLKLHGFPKLRISLRMVGSPAMKAVKGVYVKVNAELGFLNDKAPITYGKNPVYVCMLAETSDGLLVHFCRISGQKLGYGQSASFVAAVDSPNQVINAYAFCDDIAGTLKHAVLHPKIPQELFTVAKGRPLPMSSAADSRKSSGTYQIQAPYMENLTPKKQQESDEDYDALDDTDLIEVARGSEFAQVNNTSSSSPPRSKGQLAGQGKRRITSKPSATVPTLPEMISTESHQSRRSVPNLTTNQSGSWEPKMISNGRWKCKHTCKPGCKHTCCQDGLQKPPKPPKMKAEEAKLSGNLKDFLKPSKLNSDKSVGKQRPAVELLQDQSRASREQRDPSTLYDENAHAFDDLEEDPSAAVPGSSILSPGECQSLFWTDSSSLQKSNIDFVDVSSSPQSNQSVHTGKRPVNSEVGAPQKRQRTVDSFGAASPPGKGQLTFSDLNGGRLGFHSGPTYPSHDISDEISTRGGFEAWDAEAEDLFGHSRPEAELVEKIDAPLHDTGKYEIALDGDLDELFNEQDNSKELDSRPTNTDSTAESPEAAKSIPNSPTHGHETGENSPQQPTAPKISSAEVNMGSQNDSENPDKFETWLMEQFGHCVEFV